MNENFKDLAEELEEFFYFEIHNVFSRLSDMQISNRLKLLIEFEVIKKFLCSIIQSLDYEAIMLWEESNLILESYLNEALKKYGNRNFN